MSTPAESHGIHAAGVSRAFGDKQAVRDASLSVEPGGITALVGPNGSGKTTLMLMLATLLRPDTGTISIGGHDVLAETRDARASLGWMPDILGAWNTLTVRETLAAVCAMYGIAGRPAEQRIDALLDGTGLRPLAGQRSHTLSRGQKQRLSLARALVHEPRVLLLDEPASGLDPEARLSQRESLRRLADEGTAVLVTSHVLDELEQLARDVVFLRDGRTEAGTPPVEQQLVPWRVRAFDIFALEQALAWNGLPWTRQTSLAGVHCVVELQGEAAAAWLLRTLVTAGVDVVEFAPATGSLERAFVSRIRGAEGPGAAPDPAQPLPPAPPPGQADGTGTGWQA